MHISNYLSINFSNCLFHHSLLCLSLFLYTCLTFPDSTPSIHPFSCFPISSFLNLTPPQFSYLTFILLSISSHMIFSSNLYTCIYPILLKIPFKYHCFSVYLCPTCQSSSIHLSTVSLFLPNTTLTAEQWHSNKVLNPAVVMCLQLDGCGGYNGDRNKYSTPLQELQ